MRNPTRKATRLPAAVFTRKAKLLKEREAWLSDISPDCHFHRLFELLDNVCFFAKNRRGETMLASSGTLRRYGMRDEDEILGTTDFDRNPLRMARGYVDDDAHIFETGEPILNRVELWFDAQGIPDWYVTHKLPLRSRRGEIIGIMGILQSYGARERMEQPFREIAAQVDWIRKHLHDHLRIEQLAEMAGITARQLERRFKVALGVSPLEFIIQTRILAACRALRETTDDVVSVAMMCGFYDQSSFARQFKKHVGQTPIQFRRSPAKCR